MGAGQACQQCGGNRDVKLEDNSANAPTPQADANGEQLVKTAPLAYETKDWDMSNTQGQAWDPLHSARKLV